MNFDPIFYKKSYKDLYNLNEKQLLVHWKKNGIKENRLGSKYFFYNIYPEFDLEIYKLNNFDLKHMDDDELICHYWTHGCKENRICKNNEIDKDNIKNDIKINEINNKILVILPTYNRPDSCIQVIKQMNNQTYKNFDLLIIDDGSIESNYLLLKQYIEQNNNSNLILKRNNKNLKIPKTLNIGLNYFLENNYDNVTWISDDNIYYNIFLQILVNEKADFCYTNIIYDNKINKSKKEHYQIYKNVNEFIDKFNGLYSFMWSKNAIKEIGFYNEELFCVEDFDYFIRTFNICQNIKFNKIPTMEYILHNNSLYQTKKNKIDKLALNLKLISKNLINNNKIFMYYSKTSWKLLFQRPHQICRFFDKEYIKVFITNENIIKYEEKYNLLVIPYNYKNIIFNLVDNFTEKIIYYTDSRLFDEINIWNLKFKILFDLIDAPIDEFSIWKTNLEKSVKSSDFVIYSHPKLVEFLNEIDNIKEYYYISNGCDYEHFSKAKHRIGERPYEYPETDKPILGYYGSFAEWLDYDLLKKYADEGKYHIVMIGGIKENSNYNIRIEHENITWINHKSYDELPYYLSWFDVCFLPFKECELNTYVNPCKLWEYMASGKDIIKSGIHIVCNEIVKYEEICKELKTFIKKNNINLSIVLLCFNKLEYTRQCIDSVLKNTINDRYELIVVNNGSTDGTYEYLNKIKNNNINIIHNESNLGFAKGMNIGAKNANGKYLILLNNDTIVGEGWEVELIKALESDENIFAATPLTNLSGNESRIDIKYNTPGDFLTKVKEFNFE
jgi:GT2 family glycosyltransferase